MLFTSAEMKKDVTVYATAGARRTLLAVAKQHKVPLQRDCENGECGACAIRVTVLSNWQPLGMHLTEKEKTVLRTVGKLSKQQIEDAELRDAPPRWRLACQYIVRDEDILVRF